MLMIRIYQMNYKKVNVQLVIDFMLNLERKMVWNAIPEFYVKNASGKGY